MKKNTKILMISTVGLEKNGIHTWIKSYYHVLEQNHQVSIDIIAPTFSDELFKKEIIENQGSWYVFQERKRNPLLYIFKLRKLMVERKYDIVHVHGSSNMLSFELPAAKLAGCQVRISHSHNTSTDYTVLHNLLSVPFNLLITDRLACGNDAGRWLFREKDFTIIRNSMILQDYSFNEEVRNKLRLDLDLSDKVVLGHIGGFNYQKNQEFLVEVMKSLRDKELSNSFSLIFIGEGAEFKRIQQLVKEYDLNQEVLFLGAIDNVIDYLQVFDLFVMPSIFEGLPFILIEAQAAGLPIISSDAITSEVDLLGTINFLPLEVEQWTMLLIEGAHERHYNHEKMKSLGYDLEKNGQLLFEHYQEILKKNDKQLLLEELMISLIMSTYNGAEYIVEQLDSIRLQSRTADEVIICDDCSTDNTVAILQGYVSYYSLSAWKIKRNNENKGWKRNFRELLQEAQGEIIFPCDQDDIWHLDKIERMTAILQENPDIKLLASNYTPIYTAEGQKLSLSREEREENQSVYKPTDLKNFFYIMRPGCVYAVKKELVKYFDTYISEEDPHDAFLWHIATLIDSLYIYNSSTIFFRRHSNNATRRVKLTKQAHIEKLNYYADVIARMGRFLEQEKPVSNETTINSVECFRKWISLRQELQNGGGIMTALKLLPYLKCYYSPRTYLADLYFLLMKGKSVNEDKS